MKIYFKEDFKEYYEAYPLVFVDIGASGGLPRHWKNALEHLKVIGFEPDRSEYERLKESSNDRKVYLNTALSNKRMTSDFYIAKEQKVSSMLEPNMSFLEQFPNVERFNIVQKMEASFDTLDHQVENNQVGCIDFIKIDAQGGELLILEGAHNTLKGAVFGCEIEVEFAPLYKDNAQFSDVDQFMKKLNFYLFDLQLFRWKRQRGKGLGKGKGQLVFGNALYLRDVNSFLNQLNNIGDEKLKKAKLLKAFSICFIYGYFDYAYQLFKESSRLFKGEEQQIIEKRIKSGYQYDNVIEGVIHKLNLGGLYFHAMNRIKKETNHSDHRIGNL